MKDNKKIFIMAEAALAVMVIVLAFIMFQEQSVKSRHKISVILQDADASQWAAFRYGLKMAADDCDVELSVVSTGNLLDIEEELNLIRREADSDADAVIVQPVRGENAEQQLKKLSQAIPVMLTARAANPDSDTSLLPVTEPDHYKMGKTLAEEILHDFNGNISGKSIGLAHAEDAEDTANLKKGFLDGIKGKGAKISWSASTLSEEETNPLENQSKVDIVVALDDASLVLASEHSAERKLHGALVYGIGNSTESVYYLDIGIAECLIIPDGFSTGYQSLAETAKSLKVPFRKMKSSLTSFTVMRKEELFSEENQKILFTMNQ